MTKCYPVCTPFKGLSRSDWGIMGGCKSWNIITSLLKKNDKSNDA